MERITAAELAALELFRGENPQALEWLAERLTIRHIASGEQFVKVGDPAREMMVVLEGEVHFAREGDLYGGAFVGVAGQATGVLPFSRMTSYRGNGWAVKPTRAAFLETTHLAELVQRAPLVTQRLVGQMVDRSRESTQRDERTNNMLALGKLSAGLAHELNNPASAVVRSATRLRAVLAERRRHAVAMRGEPVSPEAQRIILDLGEMSVAQDQTAGLDALELADREADLADWLEARDLPCTFASALVESGIQVSHLAPLESLLTRPSMTHGLAVLAADREIASLSREIEEASTRIAELVKAMKAYSYMDRVPFTDVDVEQGIDVTMRMFQHHTKQGFQFSKRFAGNLPKIRANGSELNQIWTNLIDNAIDAMCEHEPKRLEVRTMLEPDAVVVEVEDSGPGMPGDVQARIFDPFFTTKEVGKGTGLGLDIVRRIVQGHKGSIQVRSAPGRTVFQVRLPVRGPESDVLPA